MHLLNASTLQLEEFVEDERPKYAILSHRWEDEEVLFRDIQNDTGNQKKGFLILRNACKRTLWDGLTHIWIDTCCIDKSSSAELSEAINSMYRWYAESDRCYAYLFDVSTPKPRYDCQFDHSVWFTRCWTLQELIAPARVIFYDHDWCEFGTRASLAEELATITGIPLTEPRWGQLTRWSTGERMRWASGRSAARKEDVAYSLMGLFDINMPLLYGEGQKAFRRLQEEIVKTSNDPTILM